MAKKATIGLGLYFNNETNSGIVNYVYNIIAALNTLATSEKPSIILLHNETAEVNLLKSIQYPDIKFVLDKAYSNRILKKIIHITERFIGLKHQPLYSYRNEMDCFYPFFPFINGNLAFLPNKIEWLVDFNNLAYPHHYQDKGESMQLYQKELTSKSSKIVLSSETLLTELKHYYPNFKNDVRILKFACSLPQTLIEDISNLKKKHAIVGSYFMSPNQFWEHKNQIVVLEAIKVLNQRCPELNFKVIFTGSLKVNRGKGMYAEKIQQLVSEYKISNCIVFLGLLDREEQLSLMNHSLALIQPSLYEGWSSLVEEAKALNKYIFLSDLPVHREQIHNNASFFVPTDYQTLSELMEKMLKNKIIVHQVDYQNKIRQYGQEILNALLI